MEVQSLFTNANYIRQCPCTSQVTWQPNTYASVLPAEDATTRQSKMWQVPGLRLLLRGGLQKCPNIARAVP